MESNAPGPVTVRLYNEEHTVLRVIIEAALYGSAFLMFLINASIAIAFLLQKLRRPAIQVSPAGLLVLNLLFADAFNGAVIFHNMATMSTEMVAYRHWCSVRLAFLSMAALGSNVSLINVVVDRYIAIAHTFTYRDKMTFSRSVAMVCSAWSVSIAAAVGAIVSDDWRPGLAICTDMEGQKMYLRYVLIPSHVFSSLCVLVIQCKMYLCLRRHDMDEIVTSNRVQKSADKSAWILCRFVGPMFCATVSYDVMVVVSLVWMNKVIIYVFHVNAVLLLLSILANPMVYSYATASIRKPVGDLCGDIKNWLRLSKSWVKSVSPQLAKSVVATENPVRKSSSDSDNIENTST